MTTSTSIIPQFLERPWSLPSSCPNTSPVADGAPGGRRCAFTRLFGKPFTITEFNYSSPGRFRGVGGILTGALGAVQDWDGVWRFAYAHNRNNIAEPGPLNYFDVSADPLNQAAERASLCLFLRGDLQPAQHAIAITATTGQLLESPATSRDKTPPWDGPRLADPRRLVAGPEPHTARRTTQPAARRRPDRSLRQGRHRVHPRHPPRTGTGCPPTTAPRSPQTASKAPTAS